MKVLQVWMPLFGRSIAFPDTFRDMQRALAAWDCDHRVWIGPGFDQPARWPEDRDGQDVYLRAVPGEILECLDIYHVGENGFVVGLPDFEHFPKGTINGLLDAWLEWPITSNIVCESPPTITVDVPEIVGVQVAYRTTAFRVPVVPLTHDDQGNPTFPASPSPAAVSSPETELAQALARDHGGLHAIDQGKGLPPLLQGQRPPNVQYVGVSIVAPPPLTSLFPTGVAMDALFHCMKMVRVVELSKGDPIGALHHANTWAAPYVSVGRSTRALAWYLPTFMEAQDPATVIQRAATLGLNDVRSFDQLRSSTQWKDAMTEYVPVRRAWGPIGLFWSLLIERLEEAQPVVLCERCGRSLTGKRGKRLCSRNDNLDCYQSRRATDRRRERVRAQRTR